MRCLLVDDDVDLLRAFRLVLEEGDELTVVGHATTADEALRRTEELQPDVVLLDVGVADEDAIDVARRLVGQAAPDAPKLIFMSAYDEGHFLGVVSDSPAVGFIGKPDLSPDTVMDVLGRAGQAP